MNCDNNNRIAWCRVWGWRILLIATAGFNNTVAADEALEELLFSDWEQQAAEVNEGELHVFDQPLDENVHLHSNRIRISADSLQDGWVELWQCHRNLDAVPALEIRFRAGTIRKLQVTEARHIKSARVEGDSVQLQDIAAGSRLCLSLQTRALHRSGDGFELVTGPYMRRFLDGYYPMHVQLEVTYPPDLLQLVGTSPDAFRRSAEGRVSLELWFEGRLMTRLRFVGKPQAVQ